MATTFSNHTGDGLLDDLISTSIELPDTGTTLNLSGSVQAVGATLVTITPATLAMPAAPASGSIFWNVQVDKGSGVATVQQSTSADPAPLANNEVVLRQTLGTTSTDPALTPVVTPDTY